MKTQCFKIMLGALALVAGAAYFTGCASTTTRESTGEYVDDTVITTKVKAAFARDKVVSAMAVKVETFKGVVQLSGFVNSAEERQQAERLAGNVSGVRSVANNILIKAATTAPAP